MATLSERVSAEIVRLLNDRGHRDAGAISHLAMAAARSAESLSYLTDLDDRRFRGIWPIDDYNNNTIDDAHVRWATTGALTSLDLCMAAAAKLGGFSVGLTHMEVSIRNYYRISYSRKVTDNRHSIPSPWRAWLDKLIADPRYEQLLSVRNALVHRDALRSGYLTTDTIAGHALRTGYNIGPLNVPVQPGTHIKIAAREAIELSRDIAQVHMGSFIATLQSIP